MHLYLLLRFRPCCNSPSITNLSRSQQPRERSLIVVVNMAAVRKLVVDKVKELDAVV